jgi:hypothetical protein
MDESTGAMLALRIYRHIYELPVQLPLHYTKSGVLFLFLGLQMRRL